MAKKGIITEFREFISKGNVMNLAVGVIIGSAFQTIVNSVVNDILMPVISVFTKGIDFSEWFFTLDGKMYDSLSQAKSAGAAIISYGNFLSASLNFLIMALVIFFLVKLLNKLAAPLVKKNDDTAKDEEAESKLHNCPYCKKDIDKEALRCPYCTSELGEEAGNRD